MSDTTENAWIDDLDKMCVELEGASAALGRAVEAAERSKAIAPEIDSPDIVQPVEDLTEVIAELTELKDDTDEDLAGMRKLAGEWRADMADMVKQDPAEGDGPSGEAEAAA